MINTPQSAAAKGRLDSWKDIAAYLGRDVRTVIRWQENGLPVHRVPGGRRKAVFAYCNEIDDWMRGKSKGDATAPAAIDNGNGSKLATSAAVVVEETSSREVRAFKPPVLAAIVIGLVLVLVIAGFRFFQPGTSVQITKLTRLSRDAPFKMRLATDGSNLYFSEYADGKFDLSWMPVSGGDIGHIATPFSMNVLQDVYGSAGELLVQAQDGKENEAALWIVPVDGRPLRRVTSITCNSAASSPEGRAIVYSHGNSIFITLDEGTTSRELGHFDSEPRILNWSKSGNVVHFVMQNSSSTDPELWEINMGARFQVIATSRVPSMPQHCCEAFVDAGGYEFLTVNDRRSQVHMWARPDPPRWLRPPRAQSVELPNSVAALESLAADVRSGRLFGIAAEPSRGEFVRFEPFSRTFTPFLPGVSGIYPDVSRDGKWAAYVDFEKGTIWISSTDGKLKRQLTSSTFESVELPRWSPDGSKIAFTAKNPGQPWRIYVLSREGGIPREVSSGEDNQGAPTWSPDGKWLAYANVSCYGHRNCAAYRIEIATGKIETIPGSGGLRTARWSPDGRYIAALQEERHQLMVFDLVELTWRKLSDSIVGDDLSWSPDSKYL